MLTSAVLCASYVPASALSWNTQMNCASDYYAYCSMHTAGSAGCHACMRANRSKLSSACVGALTDDGVLAKASAAKQKRKVAMATAKAKAPRKTAQVAAQPVAPAPSAKAVDAVAPAPKAASSPETKAVLPTPPPVRPAPAIDQQTYEALKNRAPYFVPLEDIASIFARPEEGASPQPPSPPR
jgi:hypothetical protein